MITESLIASYIHLIAPPFTAPGLDLILRLVLPPLLEVELNDEEERFFHLNRATNARIGTMIVTSTATVIVSRDIDEV